MKKELDKYIELFLSSGNPVFYIVFFIGLLVLVLYLIYYHIYLPFKKQQSKEKIELELRTSKLLAERFKNLSFQVQEKIELEKQRLARELHDGIGQNLLLLNIGLSNETLKNVELPKLVESTLKDLREILFNLRPRALEDLGLCPAVVNLTEHFNKNSNITGSVNVSGKVVNIDKEKELFLYRSIQEAVSNIIKHSGASEYGIQIIYNNDKLKIMAIDNGKGMNVEEVNKGHGLFNIEERLKYLGGKLHITSATDEGTCLVMEIPYER